MFIVKFYCSTLLFKAINSKEFRLFAITFSLEINLCGNIEITKSTMIQCFIFVDQLVLHAFVNMSV